MATGDQSSFASRLRALLPRGWFADPGSTPFLDGVLGGLAFLHASGWAWVRFAAAQLRLATATGEFLDMLSGDFLGVSLPRRPGETDDAFRARIRREILRPKGTRAALVAEVLAVTGNVPTIVEPTNATDCGGYGSRSVAGGGGGGLAYGRVGAYGSRLLPYQAFLTVVRPLNPGIPLVAGYGTAAAGYGTRATPGADVGASEYASLAMRPGVQDADILAAIASTQPAATVIWTRIADPVVPPGDRLDVDFILDRSTLG